MPSREQQPSPQPEHEREKPYVRASRFDSDQESLRAYTRAQAIVFRNDVDLSAYRIRYQDVPHVVVLGVTPPSDIDTNIRLTLSTGSEAQLPQHIIDALVERKNQAKRIGPWVEGHYRPGRPMQGGGSI